MDRELPKLRPERRKPAGFHRWRELTFLHWEVPEAILRPLVHPRLSVDTFEGRAFIGLVPFTMRDVQLHPLPRWPGMTSFHETNVRTYVHLDGEKPGVWFLSLDAASRLCVMGARLTYHLPYHFAEMELQRRGDETCYRSARLWPAPTPARADIRIRLGAEIGSAEPGSLEDFLCERYLLYSRKGPRLFTGQVVHTPYPLRRATVDHLDENLVLRAGVTTRGPPASVLASAGVDVDVYGIEEIDV